ncbi:hypothetical protein LTR65_000639 [Meristemomyces frigidus]
MLWGEYWSNTSGTLPLPPRGPWQQVADLNAAVLRNLPEDKSLADDFVKKSMSDAFDYLKYLLEELKKEEAKYEDSVDALTSQELFDIALERRWTCSDCGNVTVSDIPAAEAGHGVGLSVPLQEPRNGLSLIEYLRSVFEETLTIRCTDGACKQGKDHAGKPRQQIKRITKSPEVLVVRLARFAFGTADGEPAMVKVRNRCAFEEYLNLGEFTESGESLMYRLDGVVAHSGSVTSGHYIAAVRERDGKSFCSINDDRSIARNRRGTVEELEQPQSMGTNFDPYVLVYSRVGACV